METKFKTFHFKEIGWFIGFPAEGNTGKYANYDVVVVDGTIENNVSEKKVKLQVILDQPQIDQNYPHTVGYFKMSRGDCPSKPEYLELREIRTVEEFWAFLNAVNL